MGNASAANATSYAVSSWRGFPFNPNHHHPVGMPDDVPELPTLAEVQNYIVITFELDN